MLDCTVEEHANVMLIRLKGRLDLSNVDQIKPVFQQVLQTTHRNVLVDLEELTFMDSSGLSLLIGTFKRVRLGTGDMRLAAVNNTIYKLFEITRLVRVFEMFDSVDVGLLSFGSSSEEGFAATT